MISLILLTYGLAGQWLFGLAVARNLLGSGAANSEKAPPVEQAGLGLVLGIGLTTWLLFLWSLLGGRFEIFPSIGLATLGFAYGFCLIVGTIIRPKTVATNEEANHPTSLSRLCQFWIIAWITLAFVESLLTPQRLWDERAVFAMKAAVFFEDKTILGPDLTHSDFVQGHPRYPLLLPLAELNIYALIGEVDDRLSKICVLLLYVGLVLTVTGALSRHMARSQAWLWGALLASVPALMPHEYGFLCAQADAPVACFHGVAAVYLWDALEGIRSDRRGSWRGIRSVAIAGLCGGLAAFTKDEGIAFLMVDFGALALIGLFQVLRSFGRRKTTTAKLFPQFQQVSTSWLLTSILIFTASSAVILLPWFIHRRTLPITHEMDYFGRMSFDMLLNRLQTLTWSVPHMARRLFWEWREWGLQWWFLVLSIVLFPSRLIRSAQLLLLMDILGAIAALFVAGMLAPIQLEEHIGGSSHRFMMQVAPVAVFFIAMQVTPDRRLAPIRVDSAKGQSL